MRERLRDRAHNGWGPGGGAPGSSGVLYILVQFDGLIFFVIGTVQSYILREIDGNHRNINQIMTHFLNNTLNALATK